MKTPTWAIVVIIAEAVIIMLLILPILAPTALQYYQTPLPTPTAASSSNTTQSDVVTQGDLLDVYKEVLETTKSSTEQVNSTVDTLLKLIGVIFTVLTLAGIGGVFLANRASEKAENAFKQASLSQEVIGGVEQKTQAIGTKNQELEQRIAQARTDLTQAILELQQFRRGIEKDQAELKKSLTLIQIDEYAMYVFSGESDKRASSIAALIEMSGRSDPVIRRHCVKVFGAMEEYDESVERCLNEIANTDQARGVRREAEEALARLRARKPA